MREGVGVLDGGHTGVDVMHRDVVVLVGGCTRVVIITLPTLCARRCTALVVRHSASRHLCGISASKNPCAERTVSSPQSSSLEVVETAVAYGILVVVAIVPLDCTLTPITLCLACRLAQGQLCQMVGISYLSAWHAYCLQHLIVRVYTDTPTCRLILTSAFTEK